MSRRGFPINESGSESCHFTWVYPGGVVLPFSAGSTFVKKAADKVGANTPGWPTFRQENNYSAWSIENEVSSATITGFDSSNGGTVSGDYPTIVATGVSSPESAFAAYSYVKARAWDLCVSKLETRIKDQKVNAMVVGAEFKKTCSLVAGTANRIATAIHQIRAGRLGSAIRTLGAGDGTGHGREHVLPPRSGSVSRDFLAISYGWRPLLSDIYGACEELARVSTYQSPANKVSASATYRDNGSYTVNPGYPYPHSTVTSSFECTASGTIEYGVGSQMAATAASTGITNPASVIWELIPYSFVVDWFLPVGNYLNNFDYDNGLIFIKGWIVQRSKGKVTVALGTEPVSGGSVTLSFSGGSITSNGSSYERSALGGFPAVPTPHFKDPSSLLHASEALALLNAAFTGGDRYR